MEVTDGGIRTDKSWWYLADYIWSRGKWVTTDAWLYLDLVAKDADDQIVSLNSLRSDEVSDMLGIWIAPNENKK